MVARDIDKWTQLIRSAGIRAAGTDSSSGAPAIKHRRASAASAGLRYVTDERRGITPRAPAAAGPTTCPTARASRDRRERKRHQLARDPAGVDRRVDLPRSRRPHPGHRARRARPQAVPLPPGVPRRARPARSSAACSSSARCCRGSASASSATCARADLRAAAGPRDGGAAARPDAHPRRQRRVRAREQAPSASRRCAAGTSRSRARRSLHASAARAASSTASRVDGPRASRASSSAARTCRARSCSSTSTTTASARRSPRTTSTSTCARSPGATSRRRTSAPGAARCSRRWRCARWGPPRAGARPSRNVLARDRRGGRAARQHARRVPQVLHPPGAAARLPDGRHRAAARGAGRRRDRRRQREAALRRDEIIVLQFLQERIREPS